MTKYLLISIFLLGTTISALSQSKYDSLLKIYQNGTSELSAEDQMYLSNMAARTKNNSLAKQIADKYIAGLSDKDALGSGNIQFIIANTHTPSDRGFNLLTSYPMYIDTTLKDPFLAEKKTADIIIRDEKIVNSSANSPDWKSFERSLDKKYSKTVASITTDLAKLKYFKARKDSINYVKTITSFVKKYGSALSTVDVNNYGYEVFLYTNSKPYLTSAIQWLDPIVNHPATSYLFIDTYANLLYKADRSAEAIKWEEKALSIAPRDKDVAIALDKMKKGEKTW